MMVKFNRIDTSPEIQYCVKEIIIGSILQIENKMTPNKDTPMRQTTKLDNYSLMNTTRVLTR
jgi:hypothetical protein